MMQHEIWKLGTSLCCFDVAIMPQISWFGKKKIISYRNRFLLFVSNVLLIMFAYASILSSRFCKYFWDILWKTHTAHRLVFAILKTFLYRVVIGQVQCPREYLGFWLCIPENIDLILFAFRWSIQDYKIHEDIEMVKCDQYKIRYIY